MIKDILEVALNSASDVVQSCVRERFPDKSTAAEKRRLLKVIVVGFALGGAIILVVVLVK